MYRICPLKGSRFTTQSITGTGQVDLAWGKKIDAAGGNYLFDSTRGATKFVSSDGVLFEETNANSLISFDADGISVGTSGAMNGGGAEYIAWCLKKDPEAFDIVKYTGDSSAGKNVPHNMIVPPEMKLVKNLDQHNNWRVFHTGLNGGVTPENYRLTLNADNTESSSVFYWNNTAPTSNVFTLGASADVNGSGDEHIAYLFASKAGVSKVASYDGDGDGSGQFIDTGFDCSFFMYKRVDAAGDWNIYDSVRGDNKNLQANLGSAGSEPFTFASGGVNVEGVGNTSGGKYIYLALV